MVTANVVVLAGSVAADLIVPCVRHSARRWAAMFTAA
jgi:hypothetical protein